MLAAYFVPPRVDLVIIMALLLFGQGWALAVAGLLVVHAALRPSPDQGAPRPGHGAAAG